MNVLSNVICLSVLALLVSACGGNAPSVEPTVFPPTQAIEGGGLQAIEGGGIISKFGTDFATITISGVDYDATDQQLVVTVNNSVGVVMDLRVGNVVTLKALESESGGLPVLESINKQTELQGPVAVATINLMANTFEVLGQLVQITSSTVFDESIAPNSLEGLVEGDFVEVSGLVGAGGTILASRVEIDEAEDEFEVNGVVSSLNASSLQFLIGDLIVDYSTAELEGFGSTGLQEGDLVEVEGNAFGSNNQLIATEVELDATQLGGAEGSSGNIEGVVTRFVSVTDFDVAGYSITTTSDTEFERGTSADLMLEVQVKVEGTFGPDNVLEADKVEFTADEAESAVF